MAHMMYPRMDSNPTSLYRPIAIALGCKVSAAVMDPRMMERQVMFMASVEREKPARELVSRRRPMMEAVMGKMATSASWIIAVGKAIWKSLVVSSRRILEEDVDEESFSSELCC
mmetsp:Transcript_16073/g.33389  ORF Transcript_16073/g.33389 Transcript_16073/m.33389 type:complete len:114 (+) Transcript_16073:1292-1633(+)